ncbi:small heat shock protein [Thelephora terrestris]|uniref:Small heat shock protein n=1 Tax=Thelephora terrestris TaxID=56493 RepID=A0A9P6LB21_9AGAM|nr:small heat shock protein [Thelephora terrestris]
MSISRIYPFFDLDQFIDDTLRSRGGRSGPPVSYEEQQVPRLLKPRMDLHEDAEKNLVTATFELPGLTKDKVNIDMHAGNLIISGEVSESTEKTEHGYAVRERRTGRFSRSVGLPEGTKPQDIKASMENGVLTVTYPKATAGQEPQRIAID